MDKKSIIKYAYYNELGQYCVVLDSDKLKKAYNAKEIYLDTEE